MPQTLESRRAPSGPVSGRKVTATVNIAQVNAGNSRDVAVAVAGLRTTDMITAAVLANTNAGISVGNAYCSAAGTATVRFNNCTAGNITPGNTAMGFEIRRFSV